MLLILGSWIVMFCIFAIHGGIADQIFRLHAGNPFLKIMVGMVVQTLLLTVLAFFFPIGEEILVLNCMLTLLLSLKYRELIRSTFKDLSLHFRRSSRFEIILMLVVLVTALLKCAQYPFILDNESYYVQTIRWINEHGFVIGLANFNISFAQSSGWHVLQAAFNGHFFTDRLNDINGFLLVVFTLWSISVARGMDDREGRFPAVIFVILCNVLLYQFINAPSPDLPLILLSQVVFFLYTRKGNFDKMIILLLLYLVFLKITVLPFLLIIGIIIYERRSAIRFLATCSIIFLGLYIGKSLVLTGYPVYPLPWMPMDVDWTVPTELIRYISDKVYDHEFVDVPGFRNLTMSERLWHWFNFGGINGLMNKLILILFAIVPFTQFFKLQTRYKHVYVVCLIHFILVLLTSPQFRFFLPELIFLGTIAVADFVQRARPIKTIIRISLITAAAMPLLVMTLFTGGSVSDNRHNVMTDRLQRSQFYLPERNSRYEGSFTKHMQGNLNYFSPSQRYFFFATGDGPLPCSSQSFMRLVAKKYTLQPALRTGDLDDGFYSTRIK